jgi:hypothetical protein
LVGLAVLTLFSDAAQGQPLVCVVDDAQWLDRASAQALVFVARRLLAESVALVFATRELGDELAGFPKLVLEGLPDRDARALLGSALGVALDDRVRERIVAETHGNPLALLELPRGLTAAELAGGFGLPDTPGLSVRIEDSFRSRLARLLASGRAPRDRSRGGGRHRRVAHDRHARDLSPPAGPLGGVSGGLCQGKAGCSSGAGGHYRP